MKLATNIRTCKGFVPKVYWINLPTFKGHSMVSQVNSENGKRKILAFFYNRCCEWIWVYHILSSSLQLFHAFMALNKAQVSLWCNVGILLGILIIYQETVLYLELNYIYVRFCNHSIYPSIFLSTYQLGSGAGACPSWQWARHWAGPQSVT